MTTQDTDKELARAIQDAARQLTMAIVAARKADLVVEVDYEDIDATTYEDRMQHKTRIIANIDTTVSRIIHY